MANKEAEVAQEQAQMAATQSDIERRVTELGRIAKEQQDSQAPEPETPTTVIAAKPKTFNMDGNPYDDIMFNHPETTAEQKIAAIAELRSYDKSQNAEDNTTRLEQYKVFKQSEMNEWRKMEQQILSLIDPKTFSELREMMVQVTEAMAEFDEILDPLQAIIDALEALRKDPDKDIIKKIYRSYALDDAASAKRLKEIADLQAVVDKGRYNLREKGKLLSSLQEETGLRGRGDRKRKIGALKFEIAELQKQLNGDPDRGTPGQIKELETKINTPADYLYPEHRKEKDALRVLITFDAAAWEKKANDLKVKANNQINVVGNRSTSVVERLDQGRLDLNQMIGLESSMRSEFEIFAAAEKIAMDNDSALYEGLKTGPEGEKNWAKAKREIALEAVELYTTESTNSALDTKQVLGQLEKQNAKLNAFRADNIQRVSDANRLVGALVSELASGTNTAVFSLFSAATVQAQGLAEDAVERRVDKNNDMTKTELDRIARNFTSVAESILKDADELREIAANQKSAAEQAKAGMAAIAAADKVREEMRQLAKANTHDFASVTAESNAQQSAADDKAGTFNKAAEPANDTTAEPAAAPGAANRLTTDPRRRGLSL